MLIPVIGWISRLGFSAPSSDKPIQAPDSPANPDHFIFDEATSALATVSDRPGPKRDAELRTGLNGDYYRPSAGNGEKLRPHFGRRHGENSPGRNL